MKFFIHYQNFYDCSGLIYALAKGEVAQISRGEFTIHDNGVEYHFSNTLKKVPGVNLYIVLLQHLSQSDMAKKNLQSVGIDNYKLIQMQIIENYHCDDESIINFLDQDNIILSSATVKFTHPNFVHDPFFNLFYLYYFCGYNYLNFHQNTNKRSLMGMYYRPVHVDKSHRPYRTYLHDRAKKILHDDLTVYTSLPDTNFSNLLESNYGFGLWSNTYISTYTDYTTSVCNIMFETLTAIDNANADAGMMYNREYITEKTLQAILYSKENIFFLWYGPKNMMLMLREMGFWFLNFEFYDENDSSDPYGPYLIGPLEKSIIKSCEYLKSLKNQYHDNNIIHGVLLDRYSDKLKNNGILFDKLIESSRQKEKILELIRK